MIISYPDLVNYLKTWLTGFRNLYKKSGFIVPITGGVDSFCTATLLLNIRPPIPLYFLFSNIKSDNEKIFEDWVKKDFCYDTVKIIKPDYSLLEESKDNSIHLLLSYISLYMKKYDLLSVGKVNKNEYNMIKTFDLDVYNCYPIIDLYRSEVIGLSKYMGVPKVLLEDKSKFEKDFGFSYEDLEWLDRENINTGIIDSNQIPTVSKYWGIFDQRKKQLISKVYMLNKNNKHLSLPEEKKCLVRKVLPGILS